MVFITYSEAETMLVGEELGKRVKAGNVIALYGDLGAGKTVFVRGLAKGLGISARVYSPTFTIVNEYQRDNLTFNHFDMYRISGSDELFDIGWDDYVSGNSVCAIEWSENVDDAFDFDIIKVKIEKLSDDTRKIKITGLDIEE